VVGADGSVMAVEVLASVSPNSMRPRWPRSNSGASGQPWPVASRSRRDLCLGPPFRAGGLIAPPPCLCGPLSGRRVPGLPRVFACRDEAVTISKPPRLIHFVQAEYPKDKHDAGITARVLLSIEVGDDGKVGVVEVVESGGSDFDSAAVAAARQFLFTRPKAGGQAIPVKITYRYDFTIVTKMVSLDQQVNFEGVVLDRFKKQPMAEVTVRIKDLDLATKTDAAGSFSFTDLPPGAHKIEIRHPRLVTVLTDRNHPGRARSAR